MQFKPIHYTKDLTVFQLKAARYALGITRDEIKNLTGISSSVLNRVEKGELAYAPKQSLPQTIYRLRSLYESHGIVFFEDNTIQYNKDIEHEEGAILFQFS